MSFTESFLILVCDQFARVTCFFLVRMLSVAVCKLVKLLEHYTCV